MNVADDIRSIMHYVDDFAHKTLAKAVVTEVERKLLPMRLMLWSTIMIDQELFPIVHQVAFVEEDENE